MRQYYHDQLIRLLTPLAEQMYTIGSWMVNTGILENDPDFKSHGKEMLGAMDICKEWIEDLEKDE